MPLSTPQGRLLEEDRNLNIKVVRDEDMILLNRKTRSIKYPYVLGARLRAGLGKPSYSMGLGDCIFLDFSRGLFAIADSPERNSVASRRFMLKVAQMLENSIFDISGHIYTKKEMNKIKNNLAGKSQELLKSIPSNESCTFTGLFIAKTDHGMKGIVFHTGDSLLIRCDLAAGEADQLTENNFWMVGKVSRFFQVDYVEISDKTRFLLTTDGFSDLRPPEGVDRKEFILSLFNRYNVEEIPDAILEKHDSGHGYKDDIGLISFNPNKISFDGKRIIMGGTESQDEKLFRERQRQGFYEDAYIPLVIKEDLFIVS